VLVDELLPIYDVSDAVATAAGSYSVSALAKRLPRLGRKVLAAGYPDALPRNVSALTERGRSEQVQ